MEDFDADLRPRFTEKQIREVATRTKVQRQFSRLDNACFQLGRESCRVTLHEHFAQLLEAVGDFFGRRRLLLRSEEIVG